jgi:hypothetical protein
VEGVSGEGGTEDWGVDWVLWGGCWVLEESEIVVKLPLRNIECCHSVHPLSVSKQSIAMCPPNSLQGMVLDKPRFLQKPFKKKRSPCCKSFSRPKQTISRCYLS